jgi:hypothetical protein
MTSTTTPEQQTPAPPVPTKQPAGLTAEELDALPLGTLIGAKGGAAIQLKAAVEGTVGSSRWLLTGSATSASAKFLATSAEFWVLTKKVKERRKLPLYEVAVLGCDDAGTDGYFASRSKAYEWVRDTYAARATLQYPLVQHPSGDLFALLPLGRAEAFLALPTEELGLATLEAWRADPTVTLIQILTHSMQRRS